MRDQSAGASSGRIGADELRDWWPVVGPRVRAGLVKWGVPSGDIDDVVQEVAARALKSAPRIESADAMARWAYAVGQRVWIDTTRRRRFDDPLPATVAAPEACEVETLVVARLEWLEATRALRALTQHDREILLESIHGDGVPETRREQVRIAVRRHRARARLSAAMFRLGAAVVVVRQALRELRPEVVVPTAAAIAAAAFFGSVDRSSLDATRPETTSPRPVAAAAAALGDGDSPVSAAGRDDAAQHATEDSGADAGTGTDDDLVRVRHETSIDGPADDPVSGDECCRVAAGLRVSSNDSRVVAVWNTLPN